MSHKTPIRLSLIAITVLVILTGAVLSSARAPAGAQTTASTPTPVQTRAVVRDALGSGALGSAALGSAFTYQGVLTQDDLPAVGAFDLRFTLYAAAAEGSPIAGPIEVGDVLVSEGAFGVEVDFGDPALFDGTPLWLEVGIRPGDDGGAYTVLDPRQSLTPAPYALYAARAPWAGLIDAPGGFADGVDDDTTYSAGAQIAITGTVVSVLQGAGSGLDADLLDGQQGAYYTAWGNLTGVPADLADGDDDTTYSAGSGLGLDGTRFEVLTDTRKEGLPKMSSGCATFTKANREDVPFGAHRVSAPTTLAPCRAAINLHARSPGALRKRASMESRICWPSSIFPWIE